MAKFSRRTKELLNIAGPGLITGAADDDPSGIATYTQTGAQFGYGQLWTAFLVLPFLAAVQEACARIGAVTGKGIAAVVKEHYSKKVLYGMLLLVVVANTINLGADLGAMGCAAYRPHQSCGPHPFLHGSHSHPRDLYDLQDLREDFKVALRHAFLLRHYSVSRP
jgi:Mn2+/Fe2+ NRAMP family transporter